jgi:hypothetical protein
LVEADADKENWTGVDFMQSTYKRLQIRDLLDTCEIKKERFDEFAGQADDFDDSFAHFLPPGEEGDAVVSAAAQKNEPTPTKHEPAELVTTGKEEEVRPKRQRRAAAQPKVDLSKFETMASEGEEESVLPAGETVGVNRENDDLNNDDPDWMGGSDSESITLGEGDNDDDDDDEDYEMTTVENEVKRHQRKKYSRENWKKRKQCSKKTFHCPDKKCGRGFDTERNLLFHTRKVHEGRLLLIDDKEHPVDL